LTALSERTPIGRLLVVATPIGNLDDLSPRAAAALCEADVVACEDTRRTATLLRHAGSSVRMLPVHEHNEAARATDLVRRMLEGETIALVSDAGMPAISDPGRRVVSVIPGPSAVEAALVASGLPVEPFAFVGFFPRKAGERTALFAQYSQWPGSLVGFESPRRVGSLLAGLAAVDPDRQVAVGRELTKMHEEVVRGTAAELAVRFAEAPYGEVTVVVGPAVVPVDANADKVVHSVAVLLEAGLSPRRAADVVSRLGLGARNAAYREALATMRRDATAQTSTAAEAKRSDK
jgi:16S rRNA (cytidine1402-2'-O)-methyltransferase